MQLGQSRLDGAKKIGVITALQLFWKPALNAHLGSAALDRFHRLRHERFRGMKIGVRRVRPAAESAKSAADDADVGEVQVPVHDVGNAIADRAAAKLIRHLDQREEVVPFDRSQGKPLLEVENASVERFLEQAGNRETGGVQRLLPGDFPPARLQRFQTFTTRTVFIPGDFAGEVGCERPRIAAAQ